MYTTSPTTIKIFAAFVGLQPEIDEAIKSSKNPFLNNNYANINDINDVLKEPLKKFKCAVLSPLFTNKENGELYLAMTLIHESGEFICSEMKVPAKDYNAAQGVGSGITYARRYALKAFFNIGDKDDDGNEATGVPVNVRINNATSLQDLEFLIKGLDPKDKATHNALIEHKKASFMNTNQQFRQQPQQGYGQPQQGGYQQPQQGYPANNNFNPNNK